MANPLYKALGGRNLPGPMGQAQNLARQFNQFKANFQGDPRQQVQELLDSGKMSQEQYNQLQGMAQNFMQMLGG